MRRAAALAVGLLLLLPLSAASGQAGGVSLQHIFAGFLARHFAAVREDAPDARYQAAWYDLDGDRRLEVLVYMEGPLWCGPHGCDLLVFTPAENGWRLVEEISVGAPPIRVMERRHRGWRDLKLHVRDSLAPGEDRILAYDGTHYRLMPAAETRRRQDLGRLLIGPDGQGFSLFDPPPARSH